MIVRELVRIAAKLGSPRRQLNLYIIETSNFPAYDHLVVRGDRRDG